jgi:hypothetical protein
MSELPARVIKGYRINARGRKIPIYTEESVAARKEAIALETQKADETRPVNTVRIKKSGRNTLYQRWDGTKWLTGTGADAQKFKSLYINQQEVAGVLGKKEDAPVVETEKQEVNKDPIKSINTTFNPSSWESKTTNLRYPYEKMESTQDYIQFSIIDYKRAGLTGGPVRPDQFTGDKKSLNSKILGTVTLPVPSQIGDNNGANYGSGGLNFLQEEGLDIAKAGTDGDLDGALNKLKGLLNNALGAERDNSLVTNFFAGKAVNTFGGNLDLNQLLVRSRGAIINPNMELLFSGPKLRSFTFAFKFTPRFSKEAEEVRQIIRAFKKHSSPRNGGNFLNSPDIFQIRYLGEGGQNHQFLNRFKLCALTNMTVNYTGDGVYATYDDGTPVSSIMTLTFNELTPVYNEDYGPSVGGVGY